MTAAIELCGVSKRFGGVMAVHDVSFALAPCEIVALVGHNGAGKTTLMKLMLGLIHPTAGSLAVLGENPAAGQFTAHRRLGYLPESASFNAALTGREVLAFYARLKGEPVGAAGLLLERVGLAEAAARRVGTYSKGMRQRLGLAQALLGHPRVLLLDEPTTGLDPAFRRSFYDIVRALRDDGATVLLSSHALTELEERAQRVIIMNRGMMAANGTLAELRDLAQLPTRIVLTLRDGVEAAAAQRLARGGSARPINGHALELVCAERDKMAMLRSLAAQDDVSDLEVVPPSLDDLYSHFLQSREGPA